MFDDLHVDFEDRPFSDLLGGFFVFFMRSGR